MKKQLIIFFLMVVLLTTISAVNYDYHTYYKFSLKYDYGQIQHQSTEIIFSEEKIGESFGEYFIKLQNQNKIIDIYFFEVPNKVFWDEIDEETGEIIGGGTEELEEVEFNIFVPYNETATEMIILNQNLIKLSKITLSEYVKEKTSENTGPASNEKDKSKQGTETLTKESKPLSQTIGEYWWSLLIILILLIGILLYKLKK